MGGAIGMAVVVAGGVGVVGGGMSVLIPVERITA
jgi:hypothetical protein